MKKTIIDNSLNKAEYLTTSLYEKIVDFVPQLIKAVLILIVGLIFIKYALRFARRRFEKRNVDISLRGFLLSIFKVILYVALILTLVQALGLPTTAILGALSGLVLAVGLALQGSLSNFAGGVLILLFRPFEVGDYISNNSGTEGTVQKIDLLYTSLTTAQGVSVFSPNGTLANSVISNFTKITSRRFEYIIGIAYKSDIKLAKETIMQVLKNNPLIEQEPAPDAFVDELGDSAIRLKIRAWAKKDEYWPARNSVQEEIKVALDKVGISIPFPQREMRIVADETKNTK